MMSYGQQTQELFPAAFPRSQVVLVLMMVVSAILETTLSSGVLPRTTAATPGAAACTPTVAMCTGATATSPLAPLFVASGIEYFSIRLFGGLGSRVGGALVFVGGISPHKKLFKKHFQPV